VLPVLQLAEALLPKEYELPPETLAAKVDTFLRTCDPPQSGQVTSEIALLLRTSSSKGAPQVWHSNSNIGINNSPKLRLSLRCNSPLKVTQHFYSGHPNKTNGSSFGFFWTIPRYSIIQ
jgi:hypothetical protein